MAPLFFAVLIMAGISIPISYVIEIKNALRLFKDAADIGYKINSKKMSELPADKEGAKKLFTQTLMIPFFNLFVAYTHIEQYNNTVDLQLQQCDTFGVLEKMSSFEKEFYENNPSAFNAMLISLGLNNFPSITGRAMTGTVSDKETNSEIEFAVDKDITEIIIVKATGIYEKMSLEEQQKEVAQTFLTMYDESTEQYGSVDNFMNEVENDQDKLNLNFSKNQDLEKKDYASQKEKLELSKQEILQYQEIDRHDKEYLKSKVKKK